MLTLLAALVLQGEQGRLVRALDIPEPGSELRRGLLQVFVTPSPTEVYPPKRLGSEEAPWEFPYVVAAYGRDTDAPQWPLRFRVYSQERRGFEKDIAVQASRMLLRLWEMNLTRLGIKHKNEYNGGVVDVYLCLGVSPSGPDVGGEQLLDVARDRITKVNTIYIYDIPGLKDPLEAAREMAHEYGHASLPAVGGFKTPEDWAAGRLGECLFLRWLRDDIAKKRLGPEDAMGVSIENLDAWVKLNSDPLADRAALNGPDARLLKGYGPKAMDAYVGVALWASEALPEKSFAKALELSEFAKPSEFPKKVTAAAGEPDKYTLSIPARLAGRPVWVPIGKGKVFGGTVLVRKDGWARIRAAGSKVTVVPKKR